MAASVHHADVVTVLVAAADLARVRQAGLFHDRQRVHIGAHKYGGPAAVSEHGNETMAADLGRHFVPDLSYLLRQPGRRLRLLKRKLRVSVQVLVKLLQVRVVLRNLVLDLGSPRLDLFRIVPLGLCRSRAGRL